MKLQDFALLLIQEHWHRDYMKHKPRQINSEIYN